MSRFIHSLESRRLLSVTKLTLVADASLVVTDSAAIKADLKAFAANVAADTKAIQADLKTLPKTNAPLLKTLKTDEVKTLVLITKDANALGGPAIALAKRSAAHGVALIDKSSSAIQAKVTADITALGTVTAAPLAKLQADEQGNGVNTALQAIATANPTDTTLAADITKQQTDTQTRGTTFNAAALKLQTDLGTLASDLQAVSPGSGGSGGSGGSTAPNVVGTFNGSATQTRGGHVGRVSALSLDIATEGTDGSFTGTLMITNPGQSPQSASVTGSVTAAGKFTATLVDSSNTTTNLTGTVSGNKIKGTYASITDGGTFSVTK